MTKIIIGPSKIFLQLQMQIGMRRKYTYNESANLQMCIIQIMKCMKK